jgi:UDP-glucose 4-epimerase
MSLDEAVDLVLFAFQNGNQGDLFIQKAPACTIGDLAQAIKELFDSSNSIKVIGTRHGEKLYETLCTREEMSQSNDLRNFFQIPADNRDLNYGKYFENGDVENPTLEDYNSHNTIRLTVEEVKNKLLTLDYIRQELELWNNK